MPTGLIGIGPEEPMESIKPLEPKEPESGQNSLLLYVILLSYGIFIWNFLSV